jgi:translation initiation factor 4A
MEGEIENVSFVSATAGEHVFNVNQDTDVKPLVTINFFDDLAPSYNPDDGIHLSLRDVGEKKTTIFPLPLAIASKMLINGSKNMDDDTYYKTFCEQKKEFIEKLVLNIYSLGHEKPAPVQTISLLPLIQGRDAIIQFKAGTGKSLSFAVGALWHFDLQDPELQHVFVTSSHEVAKQLHYLASTLLPKEAKVCLCIGQKKEAGGFGDIGVSTLKTEMDQASKAQVIVCTLGKFYDFLMNRKIGKERRPVISLEYLKCFIVDEFDSIVSAQNKTSSHSLGSDEQISAIVNKMLPPTTQRLFFSATVTTQALNTTYGFFRQREYTPEDPYIVILDPDDYTLEGIRQFYVEVGSNEEKKYVLDDLLNNIRITQTIIFVNTIDRAMTLKAHLEDRRVPLPTAVFHARLTGAERDDIHKKFIKNEYRVLISTDVLSRGFDVQSINVVFNYDMPNKFQAYVHRVGRSGRFGRKGLAISFIENNPSRNVNEFPKVTEINASSRTSKMEVLPSDLSRLT